MKKKYYATEISVNTEEQSMTIVWADGHRSVYPLDGLRRVCPCADCAGGHDNMGKPVDISVFYEPPQRRWTIDHIEEVGNYAMQIYWGDGHNTGIYRWEYLRDICPIENKNKA